MHRIKSVTADDNLNIMAIFYSGETVKYCIKDLYEFFPIFKIFNNNINLFKNITVDEGGYGVSWNDELDLDANTIWEDGTIINCEKAPDINHLLAYELIFARQKANMTQKDLSNATGIYQADISKIERGIGNPSLLTLKRLCEGMGAKLKIDFIFNEDN